MPKIISVLICVPGRDYQYPDKTKRARVILDNGTEYFFGLGDDCSEHRALKWLLPALVSEASGEKRKFKQKTGDFEC
jgi:hypothetical protein